MSSPTLWALSFCVSLSLLLGVQALPTREAQEAKPVKAAAAAKPSDQPAKTAAQKIDLRAAMNVNLPTPARDREPASFETPDGRSGWVLRLPGNRPIATPAYADGMHYVGGGYGSHEFYAVNADTGKVIWKIETGDDGPTAAVVTEGRVAFNTESCTLVIVDEKTGRLVWQEWLGDPLMSQPSRHSLPTARSAEPTRVSHTRLALRN